MSDKTKMVVYHNAGMVISVEIGTGIMTAEQAIEAAKGLTFEKVWAALMESRQQMNKFDQQMSELKQRMDESHQRMEKSTADMNKSIGRLGNSQGEFTESMFSAEILDKFIKLGFQFNTRANQKIFYEGKRVLAEIDSVLENGEYVMLVEIKTKLTVDYVKDHLERIATVRHYMDKRGDGRKLLGTVAGGVVPEDVIAYAQTKGLYVLVQSGDAVAIADMPEGFKAHIW